MDSKNFTEKNINSLLEQNRLTVIMVMAKVGHSPRSPNWLAGRRPLVKPSVACGAPPWNSQFHLQHWRQSGQVLASLAGCCRDANILSHYPL